MSDIVSPDRLVQTSRLPPCEQEPRSCSGGQQHQERCGRVHLGPAPPPPGLRSRLPPSGQVLMAISVLQEPLEALLVTMRGCLSTKAMPVEQQPLGCGPGLQGAGGAGPGRKSFLVEVLAPAARLRARTQRAQSLVTLPGPVTLAG